MKKILFAIGFVALAYGTYYFVDNVVMQSQRRPVDPLQSPSAAMTEGRLPQFQTAPAGTSAAKYAPDFSIGDLGGRLIKLADFKNKVVIVNFWASWCAPCVEELPSILGLIEKFKGEVVLIAISADEQEKDLRDFLKKYKLSESLPNVYIARDPTHRIAEIYGTNKLPESYILRKENEFYRKIEGLKNWSSPAFIKTFTELTQN